MLCRKLSKKSFQQQAWQPSLPLPRRKVGAEPMQCSQPVCCLIVLYCLWAGAIKTDSGLVFLEVAAGDGASPGLNDKVRAHILVAIAILYPRLSTHRLIRVVSLLTSAYPSHHPIHLTAQHNALPMSCRAVLCYATLTPRHSM